MHQPETSNSEAEGSAAEHTGFNPLIIQQAVGDLIKGDRDIKETLMF